MAHGNKTWYPTAADVTGEFGTTHSEGLGNTASYQSSGIPVTAMMRDFAGFRTIEFSFVTRAITLTPIGANATSVSFDGGATSLLLTPGVPTRLEIKCTRIDCLSNRLTIVAELTGIPAGRCPSTWSNAGNVLFTQSP